MGAGRRGGWGFQQPRLAIAAQSATESEVEIYDRDVAQIMYTSGTTGRPKGVMQSHLSVVMAAMNNALELGVWRDAVNIAVLPLFHCAQHTLMCGVLAGGGTVIVMRAFEPAAMLDAIERERVTLLVGLPLMHQAMLDHPSRPGRDLSSLRMCVYAMAPMAETLLRRLIAEFCRITHWPPARPRCTRSPWPSGPKSSLNALVPTGAPVH